MAEQTMILRDAARRVALAKDPKARGIQSTALFDLLRVGKLLAGFYILEGSAWVEIPIGYWESLALEKFRKITRDSIVMTRSLEVSGYEAINFQTKSQRSFATKFKPIFAMPSLPYPKYRR
jgi:hypothetical protein